MRNNALSTVKLFKVYEDFQGKIELVEVEAVEQPTRYKLLKDHGAFRYRTFLDKGGVCLTREDAIAKAIKGCESTIANYHKRLQDSELKLIELKKLWTASN